MRQGKWTHNLYYSAVNIVGKEAKDTNFYMCKLDSAENGNTRDWSDGSAVKNKGGLPEVGIKRQSSKKAITESFLQACLFSVL